VRTALVNATLRFFGDALRGVLQNDIAKCGKAQGGIEQLQVLSVPHSPTNGEHAAEQAGAVQLGHPSARLAAQVAVAVGVAVCVAVLVAVPVADAVAVVVAVGGTGWRFTW